MPNVVGIPKQFLEEVQSVQAWQLVDTPKGQGNCKELADTFWCLRGEAVVDSLALPVFADEEKRGRVPVQGIAQASNGVREVVW